MNVLNSLVSIIIPVYNNEKYLGFAIESALKQTWPSKEIIVVDDGSSDNSYNVAKKYERLGVRVITKPNNGASSARNIGLQEANGYYIQFLDSDDQLSPNKIESQVIALDEQTDKVAVCSTVYFFEEITELDSISPPAYEENFLYSTNDPVRFMTQLWGGYDFKASMIQPNAWLIPKNLINVYGSWNENLTVDDDGEFFARVVLNCKGIIKTDGYNYYRKYSSLLSNLSSNKSKNALYSSLKAALLKKDYLLKLDYSDSAKKAIFTQLTELSICCYIKQPDLYKILEAELETLPSYKYNPNLGGHLINTFSKLFGWKAAKKLQNLYHQL